MKNKAVLITGGTGSFGKNFIKFLIKSRAKKIIIFSRDEMKQWEMQKEFNNKSLRFFIGDLRDKERLSRALDGVDIVVHAAALKIVPAAEYNPMESIKTNVLGSMNLIDAAIDKNVSKVIALSTDKACNPVNLYGASKLAADKLFVAGNHYSQNNGTKFSIVRYGNVIGSRGSMIPFFIEQKNKKVPFTLTNKYMTRFFASLDQAARLVLTCEKKMIGGEIFVNKNPSIKILDFLKCLDKNRKINLIGIRPGEKIHETLITNHEAAYCYDFGDYFKIIPSIFYSKKKEFIKGYKKKVIENFIYDSETNNNWLTNIQIKKIIRDFEKN